MNPPRDATAATPAAPLVPPGRVFSRRARWGEAELLPTPPPAVRPSCPLPPPGRPGRGRAPE